MDLSPLLNHPRILDEIMHLINSELVLKQLYRIPLYRFSFLYLFSTGKGRITAAEKALCWLRGWVEPDSVQSELSLLQKSHDQSLNRSSPTSSMYIMYMKRTFLIPFLIITMSYFIGHFGGMTVIQTYVVSEFFRRYLVILKEKGN